MNRADAKGLFAPGSSEETPPNNPADAIGRALAETLSVRDTVLSQARELSKVGPCFVVVACCGAQDFDLNITRDQVMARINVAHHAKLGRWVLTLYGGEAR